MGLLRCLFGIVGAPWALLVLTCFAFSSIVYCGGSFISSSESNDETADAISSVVAVANNNSTVNISHIDHARKLQPFIPPHDDSMSSVLLSTWWVQIPEESNAPKSRTGHSAALYAVRGGNRLDYIDAATEALKSFGIHKGVYCESHKNDNHEDYSHSYLPSQTENANFFANGTEAPPITQEFMIISGGIAEHDSENFPVYALDMGAATVEFVARWKSLTPPNDNNNPIDDKCGIVATKDQKSNPTGNASWSDAVPCPPTKRMGHVSFVHDDYLYVFGGILYKDYQTYDMEANPFVYRLNLRGVSETVDTAMGWERITTNYCTANDSKIEVLHPVYWAESRGGLWRSRNKYIVYGGGRVSSRCNADIMSNIDKWFDETMGHVWSYDLKSNCWEVMDTVMNSNRPKPRTGHAATLIGDELIIYGGLNPTSKKDGGGPHSEEYYEFGDIWRFHLHERTWTRMMQMFELPRSYHTMVGWDSCRNWGLECRNAKQIISTFGGFSPIILYPSSFDRNELSWAAWASGFVFADVRRLTYISQKNYVLGEWVRRSKPWNGHTKEGNTITTRFEHTAILSEVWGGMFVWGGRNQTGERADGLWVLNIAGLESEKVYSSFDTYSHYDYNTEYTNAPNPVGGLFPLLMLVFVLGFLVLSCRVPNSHHSGTTAVGEDNDESMGLTLERINTFPLWTLQENNHQQSDEAMGCVICLMDYVPGDKIRKLPCSHEFHQECIDQWLRSNTSCPACRLPLREEEQQASDDDNENDGTNEHTGRNEWSIQNFDVRFLIQSLRAGLLLHTNNNSRSSDRLAENNHYGDEEGSFSINDDDAHLSTLELTEEPSARDEIYNEYTPNDQGRSRRFPRINGRRIMRAGERRRIGGDGAVPLNDPSSNDRTAIV